MTKGEIIESVFIRASDFNLDVDNKIQRAEIGVYFSAAFGYAVKKFHFESRRESMEDIQFYSSGGSGTVEHGFLSTVLASILNDSERNLSYINLEKKAKLLPKNRGIEYIFSKQGDYSYVRINSPIEVAGIPAGRTIYYWLEDSRIYFLNLGTPICDHYVRYIIDPADLEDDDEVPLPLGVEFDILNLMADWFMNKRKPDQETNDIQDVS